MSLTFTQELHDVTISPFSREGLEITCNSKILYFAQILSTTADQLCSGVVGLQQLLVIVGPLLITSLLE